MGGTDEVGVVLLHPEARAAWAFPAWRLPRKCLLAYTFTPHNEHTRTPSGSGSRASRARTSRSTVVWPRNGNGTLSRVSFTSHSPLSLPRPIAHEALGHFLAFLPRPSGLAS
ncbi:hypothetical protein MRX96_057983 [Rhipicephalus microplus]